jgi:hypothetical protein
MYRRDKKILNCKVPTAVRILTDFEFMMNEFFTCHSKGSKFEILFLKVAKFESECTKNEMSVVV